MPGQAASRATVVLSKLTIKFGRLGGSFWRYVGRLFRHNGVVVTLVEAAQDSPGSRGALIRAWNKILGGIPSGFQVHHFVEEAVNIGTFGPEAIHSIPNSTIIPDWLHPKISGFYGSGPNKLPFMNQPQFAGFSKFRYFLKEQSWETQLKVGQAAFEHSMEFNTMTGFNPVKMGLL